VKFKFQGRLIRKATKATDLKTAKQVEGEIRSNLVRGEWGILEKVSVPLLGDFLSKTFLPFCETSVRSLSYRNYQYGCKLILGAGLGGKPVDKITNLDAMNLVRGIPDKSPSTKNTALRTLKRALRLAEEWGVTGRAPRIKLVSGERIRDRKLSQAEKDLYLRACSQPWKDIAIIILETGMRPGEVFSLRKEDLQLRGGVLHIRRSKSEASRRWLPITERMNEIFNRRLGEGEWIFPAENRDGHVNRDTVKKSHAAAITKSQVLPFPPYALRHTALSELGEAGTDPFTIAKIAGHTSILTTQRYIHPSKESVERAFRKRGVTEGSHS